MTDECKTTYYPIKLVKEDEKFSSQKFWISDGIDLENRRIDLEQEIEEINIGIVVRAIRSMISADKAEPIDIYVNSYGGSVYDGLRLYDVIQGADYTTIRVHAEGKIMSMGLIVYLAGDPEHRYASPNATFMAHSLSSGMWGKMSELKIEVKECERLNNRLLDILAEKTDKNRAWWKKEIEYKDCFYDKEKALELGIVTDDKFEVE